MQKTVAKSVLIIIGIALVACGDLETLRTKTLLPKHTFSDTIYRLDRIKQIYDSFGIEGSFVWYDQKNDSLFAYGDSLIYQRQSPASTFKILNSLIMLEEGVIKDTLQEIVWDGKRRNWYKWNQNQTLATAVRYSALWAFQEMARRLNLKSDTLYPYYLRNLNFGNQKIGQPAGFWVDNSLLISPMEQLQFLIGLHTQKLPFKQSHIETVKEIIKIKKLGSYQMSGKTGWAIKGEKNTGWYIGYVQNGDNTYFYVTTVSPTKTPDQKSHFRQMYTGSTEAIIRLLLDIPSEK